VDEEGKAEGVEDVTFEGDKDTAASVGNIGAKEDCDHPRSDEDGGGIRRPSRETVDDDCGT